MAIPLQSLSGTEVLRRGCVNSLSNNITQLKFDNTAATTQGNSSGGAVPANHIVTILNVIFCEQGNAIEDIWMWAEAPAGGNDINLLYQQVIQPYGTFIWNEKIVLVGGDILRIKMGNSANVDVYYSYIDQSWV